MFGDAGTWRTFKLFYWLSNGVYVLCFWQLKLEKTHCALELSR